MKCNHRFRPVKAVGLLVPKCTNARANAGWEPRSRYRPVEGWGFFRVARTEVMQLPAVWQDSHVTPPRSTSQSRSSPSQTPGHLEKGARVRIAVCHPQWECMVRLLPLPRFPRLPGGITLICSVRTCCSACRLQSKGFPYFMVIHLTSLQVDETHRPTTGSHSG